MKTKQKAIAYNTYNIKVFNKTENLLLENSLLVYMSWAHQLSPVSDSIFSSKDVSR